MSDSQYLLQNIVTYNSKAKLSKQGIALNFREAYDAKIKATLSACNLVNFQICYLGLKK